MSLEPPNLAEVSHDDLRATALAESKKALVATVREGLQDETSTHLAYLHKKLCQGFVFQCIDELPALFEDSQDYVRADLINIEADDQVASVGEKTVSVDKNLLIWNTPDSTDLYIVLWKLIRLEDQQDYQGGELMIARIPYGRDGIDDDEDVFFSVKKIQDQISQNKLISGAYGPYPEFDDEFESVFIRNKDQNIDLHSASWGVREFSELSNEEIHQLQAMFQQVLDLIMPQDTARASQIVQSQNVLQYIVEHAN